MDGNAKAGPSEKVCGRQVAVDSDEKDKEEKEGEVKDKEVLARVVGVTRLLCRVFKNILQRFVRVLKNFVRWNLLVLYFCNL